MSDLNTIPNITEDPRDLMAAVRAMKDILEALSGQTPGQGVGAPRMYVQAQSPSLSNANQIKVGDLWINTGTRTLRYWDGALWMSVTV